MALVRYPDGDVRLKVIAGVSHPDNKDPVAMLEERIGAYQRAVEETRRFLAIARSALGQPHPQGWACGSCGRAFHDRQAVCPACGAEEDAARWALRILDRAPDVPPEPGDQMPEEPTDG